MRYELFSLTLKILLCLLKKKSCCKSINQAVMLNDILNFMFANLPCKVQKKNPKEHNYL